MSGDCTRPQGGGDPSSPIHRLDPRAKIARPGRDHRRRRVDPAALLARAAACAVALAAIAATARVGPARDLVAREGVVLPLVLFVAVFVPFVRGGEKVGVGPLELSRDGLTTFAAVSSKALDRHGQRRPARRDDELSGRPARARADAGPRLLTLIAAFMYRYLFVITGEARRMRVALAARGYRPRHALQAAAIGRVATALFLRTFERGERVYVAMLARGYAGATPRLRALAFARADVLFLTASPRRCCRCG